MTTTELSELRFTTAGRGDFRYLYHRPKCSKIVAAREVAADALEPGTPLQACAGCKPVGLPATVPVPAPPAKACPSCGRTDVIRAGIVGAHACEAVKHPKAKANGEARGPGRPKGDGPAVLFTVNGAVPKRTRPFTIGYAAAQCTRGIVDGKARLKTPELVDLLKGLGVEDPDQPFEPVELPNGIKLGAVAV